MVTRANEMRTETREKMRGGNGTANFSMFTNEDKLPPNIRLSGIVRFPKGCSIGLHKHEGECEVFYVLEGKATVTDNGEQKVLLPGDVLVTYSGDSHSVENQQDKELVFLAYIVQG